ncbi:MULTISPECIES: response regulator transcription factor [unclassified Paenibacillus]|uniref:response regulator transcription factor n=1 Tax=unclassified Paenibacillus TaxID=185978 RepID=UPI001C101CA3|nr:MULTISPECIES: response regulator transcription factor [unclassified Paenibacillus]MBU5442027.1 response regulator transcription factor [Paenibacillus sp. MSJ-34]CAH0120459.1 Transcriptional regulatory protein WalR [Paenibacillus sp. CECT 9249]
MDPIHMLVVEDDIDINRLLTINLRKEGYAVEQAFDGKQALEKAANRTYSLVLLDLMLPYVNGLEVMRRIREHSTVPIVLLTAKGEETDKVIGLGAGADDYIVKPFSIHEVIARVQAHVRRHVFFNRSDAEADRPLSHGDLELDPKRCTVAKNGEPLNLTAKEFHLLKCFMTHPKQVFTKQQLFYQVWGQEYMGDDNTVMVHIRRLRAKIEDRPDEPRYIVTVWGMGYKLGDTE